MPASNTQPGRRERNKQAKLERIVAAAGELFADRGIDDVTTQEIADAADIGTGTLFLYAKTKGELLLLVQNAHYAEALERGIRGAAVTTRALDGIVALTTPVVECNRVQVDNGRTYLREMVFGDATEPHHAAALAIVAETEQALAETLVRLTTANASKASALARVISAILCVTMASSGHDVTVTEIVDSIRSQVAVILPR